MSENNQTQAARMLMLMHLLHTHPQLVKNAAAEGDTAARAVMAQGSGPQQYTDPDAINKQILSLPFLLLMAGRAGQSTLPNVETGAQALRSPLSLRNVTGTATRPPEAYLQRTAQEALPRETQKALPNVPDRSPSVSSRYQVYDVGPDRSGGFDYMSLLQDRGAGLMTDVNFSDPNAMVTRWDDPGLQAFYQTPTTGGAGMNRSVPLPTDPNSQLMRMLLNLVYRGQ
jgi:hypothetical protein